MAQEENTQTVPCPVLAAIDIGSNSIRMSIGQMHPDGRVEVLEQARRAVRLGQDTFRRAHLDRVTMQTAVSILREFKRRVDFYEARRVWVVATSALREARNADVFIDRVLMTTGLEVDVIDTSQEGRLTVSAMRAAMGEDTSLMGERTLIGEVGGGSTILMLLENGRITASQSLGLGSIRLQEALDTGGEPWQRTSEFIRNEIVSILSSLEGLIPLNRIQTFLAIGGDARFAADRIGRPTSNPRFRRVEVQAFHRLVDEIKSNAIEQLVSRYDLSFPEAETLVPALIVYQELLKATPAEALIVSQVSMRDGLLLEMSRRAMGREDRLFSREVIQSARSLAEKYKVNLHHAERVAACAVRLFDELQREHGLGYRHRVLLEAAALLHEIGTFVSTRAYHKHTYYLIANSEIYGLTGTEVEITAHVARYHRRSPPKPSHTAYMSLVRENRIIVNKLAAILRLAKALDVSDIRRIDQVRFAFEDDRFVVRVPGLSDNSLRMRSLEIRSDFFEDVYGMKLRFVGAAPV